MLEKIETIDQIMVNELNHVHVRHVTCIKEDGETLSQTFRRAVLNPGDDISEQPSRVQAICNAVWTLNG